jgi:transporter family protein
VIAGAIAATMQLDWHVTPSLVAFAALGGLLNGLGALTSFAAFEKGGKASVVTPLINLYPLVTVAGAWMLLGERLTRTQVAGILAALIAVVLLSQEGETSTR